MATTFTAVCHAADAETEQHGGRAVLNAEPNGDAHAASLTLFLKSEKSGTFEYGAEYVVTITKKAATKGAKQHG